MKAVILDFANAEVIYLEANWTLERMTKYIENHYAEGDTQYMVGKEIKTIRQKL